MKKLNVAVLGSALMVILIINTGCKKDVNPRAIKDFKQVNLVANNNKYNNSIEDSNLQNA